MASLKQTTLFSMMRLPVSLTKHSESTETDEKRKEKKDQKTMCEACSGLKLGNRISFAILRMLGVFYALRTPKVTTHLPATKVHNYERLFFKLVKYSSTVHSKWGLKRISRFALHGSSNSNESVRFFLSLSQDKKANPLLQLLIEHKNVYPV